MMTRAPSELLTKTTRPVKTGANSLRDRETGSIRLIATWKGILADAQRRQKNIVLKGGNRADEEKKIVNQTASCFRAVGRVF